MWKRIGLVLLVAWLAALTVVVAADKIEKIRIGSALRDVLTDQQKPAAEEEKEIDLPFAIDVLLVQKGDDALSQQRIEQFKELEKDNQLGHFHIADINQDPEWIKNLSEQTNGAVTTEWLSSLNVPVIIVIQHGESGTFAWFKVDVDDNGMIREFPLTDYFEGLLKLLTV